MNDIMGIESIGFNLRSVFVEFLINNQTVELIRIRRYSSRCVVNTGRYVNNDSLLAWNEGQKVL